MQKLTRFYIIAVAALIIILLNVFNTFGNDTDSLTTNTVENTIVSSVDGFIEKYGESLSSKLSELYDWSKVTGEYVYNLIYKKLLTEILLKVTVFSLILVIIIFCAIRLYRIYDYEESVVGIDNSEGKFNVTMVGTILTCIVLWILYCNVHDLVLLLVVPEIQVFEYLKEIL